MAYGINLFNKNGDEIVDFKGERIGHLACVLPHSKHSATHRA